MYDRSTDERIKQLLVAGKIAGGRCASWSTPPAHWPRRRRWAAELECMVAGATVGARRSAVGHALASASYGTAATMRGALLAESGRAALLSMYEMAKSAEMWAKHGALVDALKGE